MKLINPTHLHSERYLEKVYLRDLLERKYGDSGWNISAHPNHGSKWLISKSLRFTSGLLSIKPIKHYNQVYGPDPTV